MSDPLRWWPAVVVLALALIAGYRLALAHAAISAVSRTRLRALAEGGGRRAERLSLLLASRDSLQASLRLGFSLCVIAAATSGWWLARGIDPAGSYAVLIGWGTMLLLGLGAELVPRLRAAVQVEAVALQQVGLLTLVYRILGGLARIGHREELFAEARDRDDPDDDAADSIRELVDTTDLRATQRQRITDILEFSDKLVDEIMIPRIDMVSVGADQTVAEVADVIVASGFSRLPVIGDSTDDIVGVAHARDVLNWLPRPGLARDVARSPLFVGEQARVEVLLRELRTRQASLAIVVDEYGGTAGLVTVEDVIEEIVGEIHDETDATEEIIRTRPAGGWRLDARTSLEAFAEWLGVDESPEKPYNTVGGLIMDLAGDLPEPEEVTVTVWADWRLVFYCARLDGPRIRDVWLLVQTPAESPEPGEETTPPLANESPNGVLTARGETRLAEIDPSLGAELDDTGGARLTDLFAFWPAGARSGHTVRWRGRLLRVISETAGGGLQIEVRDDT